MILARLEVRHSRAIAPTRRVALGESDLPTSPAPGFGGLLLAGVVAGHLDHVDPDLLPDLRRLVSDVADGRRLSQPRLRHRLQVDTHGLVRTTHRLIGRGQTLHLDLDDGDSPTAQILAAVYAAGELAGDQRRSVCNLIDRGLGWTGPAGPALISFLSGGPMGAGSTLRLGADPQQWALEILGFAADADPGRGEVTRRFRRLVREAHPDHGGAHEMAGHRLTDLAEARRILMQQAVA